MERSARNKALAHVKLLEKLVVLIDKAKKDKDLPKLVEAELKLKAFIAKSEEAERLKLQKEQELIEKKQMMQM